MRRVVPSVRAGALEYGENPCHIPVSINGVVVDAVVAPQPKLPSFRRGIRISETRPGGGKELAVMELVYLPASLGKLKKKSTCIIVSILYTSLH